jgi:hypothetical protein
MYAVWLAVAVAALTPTPPAPEGLAALSGRYTITKGATGSVEIGSVLGGAYYEVRVVFTHGPHELRYLIAAADQAGTRPVWRFEAEPAPAVRNEGTATFVGGELVAEFAHKSDGDERVFRERWKLNWAAGLDFALETTSPGGVVRRVGSFTASRQ